MINIIDKSFDGFARAYPIIIIFSSVINSLITSSNEGYILSILILITNFMNHFMKEYIFRPIMGNKYFPILGYGIRPKGAINCGLFKNGRKSTSYGMPSGHSETSTFFSTYLILKIIFNDDLHLLYKIVSFIFLSFFPLLVMYSRVYWAKCHTLQQVIAGGIIGIIFACIVYKYKNYIFEYDWCYKILRQNKK
jgi:membrane-associated phospholipid phosphatase